MSVEEVNYVKKKLDGKISCCVSHASVIFVFKSIYRPNVEPDPLLSTDYS